MKKSSKKFICAIALAVTNIMTPVMATAMPVSNTPIPKKDINIEENIQKDQNGSIQNKNESSSQPNKSNNSSDKLQNNSKPVEENNKIKPAPTKEIPKTIVPNKEIPKTIVPNKEIPKVTVPSKELPMPNQSAPSKDVPLPKITVPSKEVPMPKPAVPSKETPCPKATTPGKEIPGPKVIIPSKEVPAPNTNNKKELEPSKDNKAPSIDQNKENKLPNTSELQENQNVKKQSNVPIEEQTLVFDHGSDNSLPSNFRSTKDTIKDACNLNLKGLKKLNISGSEQYSQANLKLVKEQIKKKKNIFFVDLRQESHGFVDGLPISWEGNGNKANMGLSKDEIVDINNTQLCNIELNKPLVVGKKTITPTSRYDEQTLIDNSKDHYIRIPVTDTKLPSPNMVDYFVKSVSKLPKNSWVHFHCKEGVGRTTTFMIMYDMMKNAKCVSMEDIIARQIKLGNLEAKESSLESKERITLLKDFYEYCKTCEFDKPFSEFAPNYKGN